MEKHIEKFLNKISIVFITIATITLVLLYLQTPQTCIPQNTPITKPHQKFPTSTCDPSLIHHRPHLSLHKMNHRLWSSHSWLRHLSIYTTFFHYHYHHHHLHNQSKVLCHSAGPGYAVMALNKMGVSDVTGVELVDSLPLVKRVDPNNLPFFDGVFDFAFNDHLDEALFPARVVEEMERTVRRGGVCVVVVEECGKKDVESVVGLFRRSKFVGADNITLIGARMTRIIMRVS